MNTKKKINFLAIGDLATDAFIKIKDAETICNIHGENCKLCLSYGGKIPYESVEICSATGNASNVAMVIKKMGINSSLLSYIGNDEIGKNCIKYLRKNKINISNIKKEKGQFSNFHYILWYGDDRTILTKHSPFLYSFSQKIKKPDYIYLTSLAENSLSYTNEIINYLEKNKDIFLIFQPGTFQINFGIEKLKNLYKRTDIFLCNHEEAVKILNRRDKNIPSLLKEIYNLGPKIVVITDGLNGAYAYNGNNVWYIKSLPHEPYESTGAGDAFSGAFVSALIFNRDIETALLFGSVNAMSVVSKVGPHKGLMTKEEIEDFIKNKVEEDYKAKKI